VSAQSEFTRHLRYLLPAYPFAMIWMSQTANWSSSRLLRGAIAISLCWSVASSLAIYPHSLSYFNELVGGPNNGHFHLGSSNVDWGQNTLRLKRWLDEHPQAQPIHVGYIHRNVSPAFAGIKSKPVPRGPRRASERDARGPKPGWLAITVSLLHRKPFDYLLHFDPVERIGYSYYVYNLSAEEVKEVREALQLLPNASDY
jgi:hypothetical protein